MSSPSSHHTKSRCHFHLTAPRRSATFLSPHQCHKLSSYLLKSRRHLSLSLQQGRAVLYVSPAESLCHFHLATESLAATFASPSLSSRRHFDLAARSHAIINRFFFSSRAATFSFRRLRSQRHLRLGPPNCVVPFLPPHQSRVITFPLVAPIRATSIVSSSQVARPSFPLVAPNPLRHSHLYRQMTSSPPSRYTKSRRHSRPPPPPPHRAAPFTIVSSPRAAPPLFP